MIVTDIDPASTNRIRLTFHALESAPAYGGETDLVDAPQLARHIPEAFLACDVVSAHHSDDTAPARCDQPEESTTHLFLRERSTLRKLRNKLLGK